MSKRKCTKEQLIEAIQKYKSIEQVTSVLGYKNANSLRSALDKNFGTTSFERLKEQFRANEVSTYIPYENDAKECFDNPIASYNSDTKEYTCRLEEVWAEEGYTQISESEAKQLGV